MRPFRALACAFLALGAAPATSTPAWRDLNHNGRLDPYENPALSDNERVADLLARMTLPEKVATLVHGTLPADGPAGRAGIGDTYDLPAVRQLIDNGVTSFLTRLVTGPARLAAENNAIQQIAAETRLGIPVTISTDPRSHFEAVAGASSAPDGFSQWPEPLGFGALGSEQRVEEFGRIVAREYRAVGIHVALSPQADLYTEPRWPRGSGTFGSDPALVSRLAGAYVRGMQGGANGVMPDGVAAVVKHWAGYGAEPKGFDAHNYYGRAVVLDNKSFALHLAAFKGALAAKAAGVMPTYAIIEGVTVHRKPLPRVGAGYDPILLREMLRREYGYRGLILSDWNITQDCPEQCEKPSKARPQDPGAIGMPWGVEALSRTNRFAKAIDAGVDQVGGADDPAPLLAAVEAGKVPLARIDDAVRRVLLLKFRLKLFDNPFVDADKAARVVGAPEARQAGELAQREAMVLLQNRHGVLPAAAHGQKVWVFGIDRAAAAAAGFTVVERPEDADLIVIRTNAQHEILHPHHFFGARQNEGSLDFAPDDPAMVALARASGRAPVVFVINLDRPAILTSIKPQADVLLATFGASDAAVLDVITGRARAKGRLPVELPSSMAAVRAQDPARPDDSAQPLFPRGFSASR